MGTVQCTLVLFVMFVGVVHSSSWEFATAEGRFLQFYLQGMRLYKDNVTEGDITKITYDPVGNRMFFFDRENKDTFIFSYDLTTQKTEPLVSRILENERVEGIAFDPVEQILFWNVYYHSSIYWFSLKPGFKNNPSGNFLIGTSNRGTSTIAIDSCSGYIYWTSIDEVRYELPSLIERARFDGSGREVVIRTGLRMPERLVIDPQTQRLYWSDGTQSSNQLPTDKHFSIESSDMNGNNRTVLYRETGLDQPMSLAVSKDYIYWSHYMRDKAWQLPKIPSTQAKPKEIAIRAWDEIVTNYKVKQQIKGVQDCKRLKSLLQNKSQTVGNDSLNTATDKCLYCVHGTKVNGKPQCKCENGYVGDHCDVSLCHNYCFQGDCSVSEEGEPQCRCDAGYSGRRCDVNVCQGYCLNDGHCSLNEENAPVCLCKADYEGERCEISACLNRLLNKHFQTVSLLRDILNTDVTTDTLSRGVKSACVTNNV